jgi:Tfp pilus assembly pilus retraction ATPase PilT
MDLVSLISLAANNGASDLHLESGLSPALRVRGVLRMAGEPIPSNNIGEMARRLLSEEQWLFFQERRSLIFQKRFKGFVAA